jgi:hypothetical protein
VTNEQVARRWHEAYRDGDVKAFRATRRIELEEMVFHRFADRRIAESWRLTYPLSMLKALTSSDLT